jgi:hypothetical protein
MDDAESRDAVDTAIRNAASRDAAIDRDVPCRTCGYNLRGLAVDGACPECNASIGVSLARDELQFANPDWLRRVRRGLIAVFAGQCVSIVAAGMMIARAIRLAPLESLWSKIATGGSVLASVVLIGCGIWLCTQPERRLDSSHATRIVRLCARVCAAAMMLAAFLFAGVQSVSVPQFEVAAASGFCIVGLVLGILYPLWLHELLRRTRLGKTEESAGVGAWLAIGAAICVAIAALSYHFKWEEGRIGAFLFIPVTALYAVTMFVATWRTLSSVEWDQRAGAQAAEHERGD